MALPQTMDINVAHQYSHIGDKLLHLTYDTLGIQFIVTLEGCDGCAQWKAKAHVGRNKTYTQVKNQEKGFLWKRLVHSQREQTETATVLA